MGDLDTYPQPTWEVVQCVSHGKNEALPSLDVQPSAILSVDVQPLGERFATAGIINGIKIWSTAVLHAPFNPKDQKRKEKDGGDGTSDCLATVQRHQGAVNVVRWSMDGRYLASGGDDFLVCIHELHPGKGRRGLGQNMEHQVENWACVQMLRGHGLNVVDLAWCSTSGSDLLCTASLDRLVIMWDASKGTMLRTFQGHDNFVKGVAWDPRGEFIASQSDDGSVMVWGIQQEGTEPVAKITEPFEATSTSKSFSSRLAWSPDGEMLCAAKGVSMDPPIHGTVRINRRDWSSFMVTPQDSNDKKKQLDIFRYNPQTFQWRGENVNYCACGGSSGMFMVWRGISDPARNDEESVVSLVRDGFEQKNVVDLAWTPDGQILLVVSMHGTMMKGVFTEHHLGTALQTQPKEVKKMSYSSSIVSANSTTIHGMVDRGGGQSTSECSPLTTMRKKRRITPTSDNDGTRPPLASTTHGKLSPQPCSCSTADFSSFFGVPTVRGEFTIRSSTGEEESGFMVKNSSEGGKVSHCGSGKSWTVEMSSPIVLGTSNPSYVAVATSGNELQVLNCAGQKVMLPMHLPASIVALKLQKDSCLLAAMSNGRIQVWDLIRCQCKFNKKVNQHMLSDKVECIELGVNGCPVICLMNGQVYLYSSDLQAWIRACTSRSDAAITRQIVTSGTGKKDEGCIPFGHWGCSEYRHFLAVCQHVGNIQQYRWLASRYIQHLLDKRSDSDRKQKIEDFCIEVATTPKMDLRDFVRTRLLNDVKMDMSLGSLGSFLYKIHKVMDSRGT